MSAPLYEQGLWFCENLGFSNPGGNDLERAWEGRQEMREVKVSDREPATTTHPHLCLTWRKCTPGSEIKTITHTPAYTQCPSLSAVPVHCQQKLSIFTWGTLGFHSSRCRGSVCAFQSLEFEVTSQLCLANNHRNSNT